MAMPKLAAPTAVGTGKQKEKVKKKDADFFSYKLLVISYINPFQFSKTWKGFFFLCPPLAEVAVKQPEVDI